MECRADMYMFFIKFVIFTSFGRASIELDYAWLKVLRNIQELDHKE